MAATVAWAKRYILEGQADADPTAGQPMFNHLEEFARIEQRADREARRQIEMLKRQPKPCEAKQTEPKPPNTKLPNEPNIGEIRNHRARPPILPRGEIKYNDRELFNYV